MSRVTLTNPTWETVSLLIGRLTLRMVNHIQNLQYHGGSIYSLALAVLEIFRGV